MPEWYFLLAVLGLLAILSLAWEPLLFVLPIFILGLLASLSQAGVAALGQRIESETDLSRLVVRSLVFSLHLLQPLARLFGRIRHGIGPWDFAGLLSGPVRLTDTRAFWSEEWKSPESRLQALEEALIDNGAAVRRGGNFDNWDLEIYGGMIGSIRVIAMVEAHGAGKQLFRLRAWPCVSGFAIGLFSVFGLLAALAAYDRAWVAALPLALTALGIAGFARADCSMAMRAYGAALQAAARDAPAAN
jgi:hypothetical protein